MKKLLLFAVAVLPLISVVAECNAKNCEIYPASLHSTDSCYGGVFITLEDFTHDRLSYKIDTSAKGYKLNFSFPADLTYKLEIITPDTTYKFIPGSIYGYSDCGKTYRYFRGGKELNTHEDFYKIEEASEDLILYSSELVSGNEIFYSRSLTAPIHRLTLQNLEKDFKNNPEFITAAKELKKRPDGLFTRDKQGFAVMKIRR